LDKPAAHAPPAKSVAGKPATPAAKPGSKAHAHAGPPDDAGQRVGGYAALSGWMMGLVAGLIVMGMTGVRPAWLFILVGLAIVGFSFYLASFLGGRLTKGWLPPAGH
jgi:predicted lipid-binding transport protein (Tim44 family)